MAQNLEYAESIIASRDQLEKMRIAQFKIRYEGYEEKNQSMLINGLTIASTVLSWIFKLPTPVTLAAGVMATAFGSTESTLNTLIYMCNKGEDTLQDMENFLDANPEYDLVEFYLPFLEIVDEGYRIVSGKGVPLRFHTSSGWITL